jgi:signal transduction histidine kinase
MSEIIDSLLTLASISSEEIRLQPVDMRQVAGQALERLSPQIEAVGATLDLPESWPTVVGHAPWIEEMWVNYISNALKYGGSPPVLSLGAEHQPDGAFMFWVRDNGPGIPLDEQPTLFEEFYRLDNHVSGHGLGLSIVRRIALKLGGEVGVRSAAGAGSCFFFSLPAAVEQQRADGVLVN